MTELANLIDEADEPGIVALLAPLTEPERAALCPAVTARVHELKQVYDERSRAPVAGPQDPLSRPRVHAAFLAWLGVADLDTLPHVPEQFDTDNMRWFLHRACAGETGHQVLAHRRPPWLAELADQNLRYGHWMWDPVWRLVMAGLIPRPSTEDYLRGVALHAGKSGDFTIAEIVATDPEILDHDVPALLDLPHGLATLVRGDERPVYDGLAHRTASKVRVWSPILAGLRADHPLRERIITGVIDALRGDLRDDAPAHQSFLTALSPGAEELAARRSALLRLAGHQRQATAGFAISLLSTVDKKRPLDPEQVVAALGPATGSGAAGTARAAVRLIATVLNRRPELLGQVAEALAPALTHRRPEVQRAAAKSSLTRTTTGPIRRAQSSGRAACSAARPSSARSSTLT